MVYKFESEYIYVINQQYAKLEAIGTVKSKRKDSELVYEKTQLVEVS